jgi:hypothetical protein
MRELDTIRRQHDQLKQTHTLTNKKLSELKLAASKKKTSPPLNGVTSDFGSSQLNPSSTTTTTSSGTTSHAASSTTMVGEVNSYSHFANMSSFPTQSQVYIYFYVYMYVK